MTFNNAQLHPAVVFKNQGYRNAAAYSRYLRRFRDRAIYPSFSIHPTCFDKYDMHIPSLLKNLGWSSLVENMRFSYCPEAVRKFYVNIKRGPGCDPSFFTTIVFDNEIKVTSQLLATLLDLPHSGVQAGTEGEFSSHGFPFDTALESLTRDIGQYYPNRLAAGRLYDDLKVLHFFITRSFLPRDLSTTNILDPTDLWILSNAKAGCPISYASLMFQHMLRFGMEYFSGPLAFGPQITKLLYKLGIDLRDKIILCNILEEVRPQHVLAKLDAEVGPRKLVNGSGGVRADPAKTYQSGKLVEALMDAAVTVVKRESTKSQKQTGSLKRLREKDLMWPKFVYESGTITDAMSSDSESEEEGGVSDYE
ncbi:unnamed protein product [Linum trigynum]|uniref:Uncharacterized protein n=1 Tax=Linum trigynum TaxID=586398 RepID=A0AAV2GLH1_9ROSI